MSASEHDFGPLLDLLGGHVNNYLSAEARLAEPLLLPLKPLDDAVSEFALMTGLGADQIKMVGCFVLSLLLGALFRRVPGGVPKHVVSLSIGILFAQICLGPAWIHLLTSSALCYALIALAPTAIMPLLVFIVALTFMTIAHIHRMVNPDPLLDYSSAQMILTIRLTGAAFAVADGRRMRLSKGPYTPPEGVSAHRAAILRERAANALVSTPDPLTFFAFIFFFGSFLVGPAFNIHEYRAATAPGARRPSPGLLPWGRALLAAVCVGIHLTLRSRFPPELWLTEEFASSNLLMQIGLTWVILLGERMKYYFVWKMTEAGCNAAGFGYRPADAAAKRPEADWNGVRNISIRGFELAQNLGECSREWNMLTGVWLRTCVHDRTPPALSLFATYFVSSFWHGFYPGYYLFFLSAAIAQTVGRLSRRKIRPLALANPAYKRIYDAFSLVITAIMVNYLASSFVLLTIHRTLTAWGAMHYFGHVAIVVAYVVLAFWPAPRSSAKSGEARAKAAKAD